MSSHSERTRDVRAAALRLTAANVVIAAGLVCLGRYLRIPVTSFPGVAIATGLYALVALFPMRLEFRRHQATFTLNDAVLVAALPFMAPEWIAVAACGGELVASSLHRVAPLKTAFNMANRLAAAAGAGVVFAALGGAHASVIHMWGASLVAVSTFALLNVTSTSAILARAEGSRTAATLVRSLPTALGTTLVAAPLGLIANELLDRGAAGPLLLVPLVVGVALNNRHAATQRDEHLRFERLYEATSRTAGLTTLDQSVATVAEEARQLVTGTVAMCCAQNDAGGWVGAIVGDGGVRTPDTAEMEALVGAVDGPTVLSDQPTRNAFAAIAPTMTQLLVAHAPDESPVRVVLGVFRRPGPREGQQGQTETLTAFATHAALTIANARLFEEVERSLHLQLDLNRQKSEFVAAVSHELRTPLAAMLGSVQTLLRLDERLTKDNRDRLLNMSLEQGGRLRRLIEDLLRVAATEHRSARSEAVEFRVIDLCEGVRCGVAPVIRDRLVIDTAGDSGIGACGASGGDAAAGVDVGTFVSDEQLLHQILVNLVENAAKYGGDGPITVRAIARGDELSLSVKDHGPGIPIEERDRVFERFVQLDQSSTRRQGGTGLGLYLCRQLALQLGGDLHVDGTPGGGSTFILTVPAAPTVASDSLREPSGLAESSTGHTTHPPSIDQESIHA